MKLPVPGLSALAALAVLLSPLGAQDAVAYTDTIPGTLVTFTMVPVPAGRVTLIENGATVTRDVPQFWVGATEVTWDMYDIFAFRLDVPREARPGIDASARPSRPYGAPDRGFGHAGHPAISMTHAAATAFARWLSDKTGHRYEVATEAQWRRAADAGGVGDTARMAAGAWSADNADDRTHPVATRSPDQIGAYDLLGNAAEWVTTSDGHGVAVGGSYLDPAARLSPASRATQDPSWNQTDPQIPKSRWWLSDATFIGFRLVRIP